MSLKGKSASPRGGGGARSGEPQDAFDRMTELERQLTGRIDRADRLSDELGRKQVELAQAEILLAKASARAEMADHELARAAGRAEAMADEITRRRTETLQISAELGRIADRAARAEREAEAQERRASTATREASSLKTRLEEAQKKPPVAAASPPRPAPPPALNVAANPVVAAAPPAATTAPKRRSLKARLGPFAILAAPLLLFRPKKKGATKRPAAAALKPPQNDREAMEMIAASGLFDPQWYLDKYRDVREAGMAPLEHYFRHGGLEGRKPGPGFDSRWYMDQAPDTVATGTNPLVHFLTVGRGRGIALPEPGDLPLHEQPEIVALLASPLFDADWYRARRPGLPKGREHVASHYLGEGWTTGMNPGPGFDGELYLRRYGDVKAAGMNPFLHYVRHGREEGREVFPVVGDGAPVRSASSMRVPPAVTAAIPATPPVADGDEAAPTLAGPAVEWRWSRSEDLPDLPAGDVELRLGSLRLGRIGAVGESLAVVSTFARLTGLTTASDDAALLFESPGSGLVVDGWFLTDRDLRIRFGGGSGPCVARGYQVDLGTGAPALVAETAIDRRDFAIADFRLINPFSPVLFCIDDGQGLIQDAAILAFPSLARNGLHHGEIVALGTPDAVWAQGARLAADLLRADGASLSVAQIELDLDGAIGGEPAFGRDFRLWLAGFMGLTLTPIFAEADARTAALQDALKTEAATLATLSRKGGLTLSLPGDAVPALAALVGRDLQAASRTGEPVPFVVADVVRSRPRWLLAPPVDGDFLAEYQPRHGGVAWPSLRRPARGTSSAKETPARPHPPLALRFTEDLPSGADTRKVFPVAVDITEPLLRKAPPARTSRVTLIMDIEPRTAVEDVVLSLESAARQDFDGAIDLVLVMSEVRPDVNAAAKASAIVRTRTVIMPGSVATRLNAAAAQAQGRFLLFLQAGVILQDRRTLKTLLTIASDRRVASAGCSTVRQSNDGGFGQKLTLHSGGTFPDHIGFTTQPRLTFNEGVAATALPATTYAVACNRFRLALVPRAAWDALGGLDAAACPDADHDLDFALRALRADYSHVCTSVVAATISDRLPPMRGATLWTDTLSLTEWARALSRMTLVRALT